MGSSYCGGWLLWEVVIVVGGCCGEWLLWWVVVVVGGCCGG